MLAVALRVQESALAKDFRWLDEMGVEDAEYFLTRINDTFADTLQGFSFGAGKLPFRHIDRELLESIATVGGLIEHVRKQSGEAPS